MTLWHKPSRRAIPYLKRAGCDHIVTLLVAHEGASEIGEAIRGAGMEWTWLPLPGRRVLLGGENASLAAALPRLSSQLNAGQSILVHCSAGIHRTGLVAYALLRYRGLAEEEALDLIAKMRLHTRLGLERKYLDWANQLVARMPA